MLQRSDAPDGGTTVVNSPPEPIETADTAVASDEWPTDGEGPVMPESVWWRASVESDRRAFGKRLGQLSAAGLLLPADDMPGFDPRVGWLAIAVAVMVLAVVLVGALWPKPSGRHSREHRRTLHWPVPEDSNGGDR